MRTLCLAVCTTILGCNAPSAPPTLPESSTAAPDDAQKKSAPTLLPTPAPGKAGWFFLDDVQRRVATLLPSGECVAVHDGRLFRITPEPTLRSAPSEASFCNGNTTRTTSVGIDSTTLQVHALGERVVLSAGDALFEVSASGAIVDIAHPLPYPSILAAAGSSLLLVGRADDKRALHRFDGAKWHAVTIDGEVTSLVGAPDGQAFAVTSKNKIFHTSDEGQTWKPVDLPEKSLTLIRLRLAPVDLSHAELFLGASRPKATQSIELQLGTLPINQMPATFRTPPPPDYTSIEGLALPDEMKTREDLAAESKCRGAAPIQRAGAVACVGSSPSELRISTSPSGGPWEPRSIALSDVEEITSIRPDRTAEGGFFVFARPVPTKERPAPPPVVIHVRGGAEVSRVPLAPRETPADQPANRLAAVESSTVYDDGTLGLLWTTSAPGQIRRTFLHVTVEGNILEEHPVGSEETLALARGGMALVGRRVITFNPHVKSLAVSEDAGKTFTRHAPKAFESFAIGSSSAASAEPTKFACGSSGCDFFNAGSPTRLAWRWGTKPMVETLAGESSSAR